MSRKVFVCSIIGRYVFTLFHIGLSLPSASSYSFIVRTCSKTLLRKVFFFWLMRHHSSSHEYWRKDFNIADQHCRAQQPQHCLALPTSRNKCHGCFAFTDATEFPCFLSFVTDHPKIIYFVLSAFFPRTYCIVKISSRVKCFSAALESFQSR